MQLLNSKDLGLMDRDIVFQERRLLHDSPSIVDKDDVESINEVLDKRKLKFKGRTISQFLTEEVSSRDQIIRDTSFDDGKKIDIVMILRNFNIFLSILNNFFSKIIMETR